MASLAFSGSLAAAAAATNKLLPGGGHAAGELHPRSGGLIKCSAVKFSDNGTPHMPTLSTGQPKLPSFLTSNHVDRYAVQKNETRLRIFSGTANPALSQLNQNWTLGAVSILRVDDAKDCLGLL